MHLSKELGERLARLEQEQLRQQEEIEAMNTLAYFASVSTTPPPKIKPLQVNKPTKKTGKGYKIRLEFSNDSPASEWSEETRGWRSRGQGSCYPDEASVQKKFQELKRRWPDYPLSVYALE